MIHELGFILNLSQSLNTENFSKIIMFLGKTNKQERGHIGDSKMIFHVLNFKTQGQMLWWWWPLLLDWFCIMACIGIDLITGYTHNQRVQTDQFSLLQDNYFWVVFLLAVYHSFIIEIQYHRLARHSLPARHHMPTVKGKGTHASTASPLDSLERKM